MPDVEDVTGSDGFDSRKGAWTSDEDAKLKQLVEQHGTSNWSIISQGVPGRSGKSCRLRWCNQLDPCVSKLPFSEWEQAVIIRAQSVHQNRWAAIARLLNGRTDNAVKNHWHATLNRKHQNGVLKNKYLEEGATLEWLLANPEHGKEPEEKAYRAIMSKAPPARGVGSKASKKRLNRGRPRWSDSSTDSEEASIAAERSCTAHPGDAGTAAGSGAGAGDFVATSGSCEGEHAPLLDSAAAAAAMPGYVPSSGAAAAVAAETYNAVGQAPASAATACSPNRPAQQGMGALNNPCSYRQLRVDVSGSSWSEPEQHSSMAAATTFASAERAGCWHTPASDMTAVADACAEPPASNARQPKTQQLPASTYNSSEVSSCGGSPSLVPSAALLSVSQPAPRAGWASTAIGPMATGNYAARSGAAAADNAPQLAARAGQEAGSAHARLYVSGFSAGTAAGMDGSMYGGSNSCDEAATAGCQQFELLKQQQFYQQQAAGAAGEQYAAHARPPGTCYTSNREWQKSSSYEMQRAAGTYSSTAPHYSHGAPNGYAYDNPGTRPPAAYMTAAEVPSAPLGYFSNRSVRGTAGHQMDRNVAALEPGTSWPGPSHHNAAAVTAVLRSASTAPASVYSPGAHMPPAREQQQGHEVLATEGSTNSSIANALQHQLSAYAAVPPVPGGLLTSHASAVSVNQALAGDAAAAQETATEPQQQDWDNKAAATAAAAGDADELMAEAEEAAAAVSADAGPSAAPEQVDGTATVSISRCGSDPNSSDQQIKDVCSTLEQQAADQQASSELAAVPPPQVEVVASVPSAAQHAAARAAASDSPSAHTAQHTSSLFKAGPAVGDSGLSAAPHASGRPRSNSMPPPAVQTAPQQQLPRMQRGYSSYTELSVWPSGQLSGLAHDTSMMRTAPGMLTSPPSALLPADILSGPQPGRRQMMPPGAPDSTLPRSGYPPDYTCYAPPPPGMLGMQGPLPAGPYRGAVPLPCPPLGPCDCWECRQAAAAGLPLPGMPPPYSRPYDGSSMGPELLPPAGYSGPVRFRPYAPSFRPHPYEVPGNLARSSRYHQQCSRSEVLDGEGYYAAAGAPGAAFGPGFYDPASRPSSIGGNAAGAGGFGPPGRVPSAPNLMAPQPGGVGAAAPGWQGSAPTPYSQQGYPGPEEGMPPQADYYSSYSYGPALPRRLLQMHSTCEGAAGMPPAAADMAGAALAHRSLSSSALGGGRSSCAELQLQRPQPSSWSGGVPAAGMGPGVSVLQQQRRGSAGGPYYGGQASVQHLPGGGDSSTGGRLGVQWQQAAVLPGMPVSLSAAELDSRPASRSTHMILEGTVIKHGELSTAAAASNLGPFSGAAAISSGPARVPTPGLSSAATAAALMSRGFSGELGGASGLELVNLDLEKDSLMGVLDDIMGPCDLEDELLMIG